MSPLSFQPLQTRRLSVLRTLAWGGVATIFSFALTVHPGAASEGDQQLKASEEAVPSRLYADAFLTWIYRSPERDPGPIGYIRGGSSVALRQVDGTLPGKPVKKGCGRGWYAVMPAGFVCLDHTASLTPTRYSESMAALSPAGGAFPFEYALSMGTPSYRRLPTQAEWQRRERPFGEAKPRPLPPHWQGHEELVKDERIAPSNWLVPSNRPSFLENGGSVSRLPETRLLRREVPFGSMIAVKGAFLHEGRSYLASADGTVVPADRFRMFRRSTFEGVPLGNEGKPSDGPSLPLGWPRKDTSVYRIDSDQKCAIDGSGNGTRAQVRAQGAPGQLGTQPAQLGQECLVKTEIKAKVRSLLELSGRTVDVAGTRFAEVLGDQGHFVPTRYLYLAEARDEAELPKNGDKKWLHFRIGQGTLTSYVGRKPVFATLASPGIGGVPAPGADPLSTRTTPIGTYRIQFKHRSDDMSPEQTEDRSFWIADVPHAMYFKPPFAIHVAYWHESFGEPMSGGCINVSPKDGERLFSFTDPPLPSEWYGVAASREFGYGTTLVIER